LLVKILVSSETITRDLIIRATNNQTLVAIAALHATDKIQRDIEEILERYNWYYERRQNYYRNIGKPAARFVTPLYLASAVYALVFKNPNRAKRLKSKFMRNQENYEVVFSSGFPIETWPALVNVYKQVEAGLAVLSPRKRGEKFISSWRGLVSFIVTARRLGTFAYSIDQLTELRSVTFAETEVPEAWAAVRAITKGDDYTRKFRQPMVRACCEEAATRYGIEGLEALEHLGQIPRPQDTKPLPDDFVRAVDAELPKQPWKSGIHHEVAARLQQKPSEINRAIHQLIAAKRRYPQKDGVVYDFDGKALIEQKIAAREKRSFFSKFLGRDA
jgi:hypothetical protein